MLKLSRRFYVYLFRSPWRIFYRLAIIDVEGGHQPLSNPQSKLYAIANGEIYNH